MVEPNIHVDILKHTNTHRSALFIGHVSGQTHTETHWQQIAARTAVPSPNIYVDPLPR